MGKLDKELPEQLTYHNAEHTRDVIKAASWLAGSEGVSEADKELLLTAALFHDSGYLENRREHEATSCRIAKEYLPAYRFSAEETEKICGMIMATRLPQSPRNMLEQILCDADLDYLGRDDFFVLSLNLFCELQTAGLVKNELEWDRQQVGFMSEHRYFSPSAINLRQPQKMQYVEWIKSRI